MKSEKIEEFGKEMYKVLHNKKNIKKGDSWKKLSIERLRVLLIKEFDEWHTNSWDNPKEERSELIDIANLCMMLFHRLKDDKNE